MSESRETYVISVRQFANCSSFAYAGSPPLSWLRSMLPARHTASVHAMTQVCTPEVSRDRGEGVAPTVGRPVDGKAFEALEASGRYSASCAALSRFWTGFDLT